jgi:hypothetical protein
MDPYWPFDVKLGMLGPFFYLNGPKISLDLAVHSQNASLFVRISCFRHNILGIVHIIW